MSDDPSRDDRGEQTIIGWREYVALPDWKVAAVKCKADTGARTSAIDVSQIEELDDDRVRFHLMISRAEPDGIVIETDIVRRTRVKSSFGQSHDRLVVATLMRLGPIEKEIELSLVSRKNMLCPMLLGRKALEPEFIVDAAHRYRFGGKKRDRKPRRKG